MNKKNKIGMVVFALCIIFVIVFCMMNHNKHTESLAFESTPILDESEEGYENFEGCGTSLTWWGHILGQWEDEAKFEEVMDLVFDVDQGLGLNVVRYNIGGGEN